MHGRAAFPAYGLNAPILFLSTAELLLVHVTRLWAAPCRSPGEAHPDWREPCRMARLGGPAERAFDGFFHAVVAGARRSLDVRCLQCPALGEDEGLLLRCVGLLQSARTREADLLLAGWLDLPLRRPAAGQLAVFARGMRDAGLRVPEASGRAEDPAVRAHLYADRGLRCVH